jgi:hypothetical protein
MHRRQMLTTAVLLTALEIMKPCASRAETDSQLVCLHVPAIVSKPNTYLFAA